MRRLVFGFALFLLSASMIAACSDSSSDSSVSQLVGSTDDGAVSLAFVRVDGRLIAYACNDTDIGEWFESDEPDPKQIVSGSGARIDLDSAGDFSRGSLVTRQGSNYRFTAAPARDEQGLYLLSGQDEVGLGGQDLEDLSIEALVNDTLVQAIERGLGSPENPTFRAGWIVGVNGGVRGNVTIRRTTTTTTTTTGNLLPLTKEELSLATQLSVERLRGALLENGLDRASTLTGSGGTLTPIIFCNSVGFDTGTCRKLAAINTILLRVSEALAGTSDAVDAFLESELNECANRLIDFC